MGQVGAAGDNAATESLFALLYEERPEPQTVAHPREQLRIAILTRIERTYHRCCRQACLGRLTPVEYEAIMKPAQALTA